MFSDLFNYFESLSPQRKYFTYGTVRVKNKQMDDKQTRNHIRASQPGVSDGDSLRLTKRTRAFRHSKG